jgi:hypothetical protein
MTAASSQQIQALQATRRRAGIDDDTWRARIGRLGVASTRDLTASQAGALLDDLRGPSGAADRRLAGPYLAKARALWISGYHLGVIADRRDDAMLAFVKRQTGYPTLAWLRDPKDGARAIEGLKAWIGREAGLAWRAGIAPKHDVTLHIFERLAACGAWTWNGIASRHSEIEAWAVKTASVGPVMARWTDSEWDRVMSAAGRKLRAALKRREAV